MARLDPRNKKKMYHVYLKMLNLAKLKLIIIQLLKSPDKSCNCKNSGHPKNLQERHSKYDSNFF